MSDGRKVICPWCGFEMAAYTISIQGYSGEKTCFYECAQCCARSPMAVTNRDAYNAATRRPPNLPLTREQVEALEPKMTPIWYATINLGLLGMIEAYVAQSDPVYWMHDGMLLFARKPNPADIAAAREAGKGEAV